VSHLADALQVLVERRSEGIMTVAQLLISVERLAGDMECTQWRNYTARVLARKCHIRELAVLGIDPRQTHLL
jgi:hypothetical protein